MKYPKLIARDEHKAPRTIGHRDTEAIGVRVGGHDDIGVRLFAELDCHGECGRFLGVGVGYRGKLAVRFALLRYREHM